MANVQHSGLTSPDTHEPKHITLNDTSATGKIITNSGSVSAQSEYRRLTPADIDALIETFTVLEINSTTVQTHYLPMDFVGQIVKWIAVIDDVMTVADNIYELRINGVQVTGSPLTIPFTASAAGDQQSADSFSVNNFVGGDNIEIVGTTIGNTAATVNTRFVVTTTRVI